MIITHVAGGLPGCRPTTRSIAGVLAVTAVLLASGEVSAQQPNLTNGRVEPHAVSQPLDREFNALASRLTEPAWMGYAVPIVSGDHHMCCWTSGDGSGCCGGCRLEPGSASAVNLTRGGTASVSLEPGDVFFVLYRIEQGRVERIRMFSEECRLDAGGRTLHWFTGVRPAESVTLLASYAGGESSRKLADSALSALAMHREPTALDRLIGLARNGTTSHVRGQALFWLAQRRARDRW